MPSASETFSCDATPQQLLERLRDIDFIASLVPEVTKVEHVDERVAQWTVRVKLGFLVRHSVYRGELLRADASGVEFEATGAEARIHGILSFRPRTSATTEVTMTLEMTGQGALATIVNNAAQRRLPEDVHRFGASLCSKMTSLPSP
ncbi:MAG: SRPBCC family protein [Thermoplasmata archaeon]